jgi:Putative DNA-binding domain
MPRFWGFHQPVVRESEFFHWRGKSFPFPTPIDQRMRAGDFVYLFWGDDYLYGWGMIEGIKPRDDSLNQVTVRLNELHTSIANVNNDIRSNPLFANYDRIKQEGCLSTFNDDQLRYLSTLFARQGVQPPPDPAEVREQAANATPLRPVVAEFVIGQKLPIDETRFDEFKTVSSPYVVKAILNELDQYVISYLNIEDRRYEDYCRIFWGIEDRTRGIVGVQLDDGQRNELRLGIRGKLAGVKPPLASSSYYVELYQVKDVSGSAINDLYVVEVAVGHGEIEEFYCSQNDSFYIRQDGASPQLKGQALIAEIRRRLRSGLQQTPERTNRSVQPSFTVYFQKPTDHNRLKIKNIGQGAASNIEVEPVPIDQTAHPGKRIDFRPISHLEADTETSLVALYDSFGTPDEQNRSGLHQDATVIQFLNNGEYTLTLRFSDIEGRRFRQSIRREAGRFDIRPVRG